MRERWRRALRKLQLSLSRRPTEELLPVGDAIFLHRPHGLPCHGITREVVKDFDRLSRRVIANPCNQRYSVPPDVTLVTYNNRLFKTRIERCYEAYGIDELIVLGAEVKQWNWRAKVQLVSNYLDSGDCATRFLVATDADDVLVVNDPATLVDRFLSYNCDVLFCNTFVDWPPNRLYRDSEMLKYYKHPFHCHLSAGGYVGEREALARYLRMLLEAEEKKEDWVFFNGSFDDQLGWRALHHRYYPKLQVDTACQVFKRYDIFKDCTDY